MVKGGRGGSKKKAQSKSAKAGLTFPVALTANLRYRTRAYVVRGHVGWHQLSSRMTMRARPQAWFVAELVGERLLVS